VYVEHGGVLLLGVGIVRVRRRGFGRSGGDGLGRIRVGFGFGHEGGCEEFIVDGSGCGRAGSSTESMSQGLKPELLVAFPRCKSGRRPQERSREHSGAVGAGPGIIRERFL
jgi:hypothetical protein